MHAALQINPYYGKTSVRGLLEHFRRVLDFGPTLIYNVPSRTGQDIPPRVIESLAKHENFLGVKECVGNERIEYYTKQGICCWSGNDDQAWEAKHKCGAAGVVSVVSNIVPNLMRQVIDDANEGFQIHQQISKLMGWLFCEPNPIPLNTVLSMVGSIKPVFRLPYSPLTEEQQEMGLSLLKQLPAGSLIGVAPRVLNASEFILL
eukprot:TRINITY_DN4163_c0_g1_i6.p1 TRINITY_DN4163_c0_g1~~TRINITY_DN4163_c0_g1_i6.p1  ORF type:complete len:204 (-),score=28.69 TRINITY_DN4163_c0_g1_i6:130-741(-)